MKKKKKGHKNYEILFFRSRLCIVSLRMTEDRKFSASTSATAPSHDASSCHCNRRHIPSTCTANRFVPSKRERRPRHDKTPRRNVARGVLVAVAKKQEGGDRGVCAVRMLLVVVIVVAVVGGGAVSDRELFETRWNCAHTHFTWPATRT